MFRRQCEISTSSCPATNLTTPGRCLSAKSAVFSATLPSLRQESFTHKGQRFSSSFGRRALRTNVPRLIRWSVLGRNNVSPRINSWSSTLIDRDSATPSSDFGSNKGKRTEQANHSGFDSISKWVWVTPPARSNQQSLHIEPQAKTAITNLRAHWTRIISAALSARALMCSLEVISFLFFLSSHRTSTSLQPCLLSTSALCHITRGLR